MLIKLNYTSPKNPLQVFRAVAEIVNQPTFTSISSLRAGSGSWAADTLQYLDDATSYIYRTKDSTGVVSHISKTVANVSTIPFDFALEFSTFDSSSTKQYVKLISTNTAAPWTFTQTYSNALNAGTPINSGGLAVSTAGSTTTNLGTTITLAGTATGSSTYGNTSNGIMAAWFYITPTSFIYSLVLGSSFMPSGWTGTSSAYSSQSNVIGPIVYSQYRRYDYWNTSANGILPFVYMNTNNPYVNFLTTTGELGIVNPNSSTATECPLVFYSYINATPSTGTSFPVQYAARGALGIGTRYSDTFALAAGAGSSTNPTDPCYGAVLNTSTVQTRIPSSDLLTKGFSILPLTIRNMNVSMLGGNISDIGDFYLFNGDYFPGDEFSYNNRTYVIFPVGLGYTTRLGLAIPKE